MNSSPAANDPHRSDPVEHSTGRPSAAASQMPSGAHLRPATEATSGDYVTPEDFRRLGVHPQECRLTEIRRAAASRSKRLAKKQLATPNASAEVELTQVATSTYRLMDPRRRGDTHQRVYVGRIMPNTLVWAGRTRFSDGGSESEEQGESNGKAISLSGTEGINTEEESFLAAEHGAGALATGIELRSDLTTSLDSNDILDRSWLVKTWLRMRSRKGLMTLTGAAVLLFGIATLFSWGPNTKRSVSSASEMPPKETSDLDVIKSEPKPGLADTAGETKASDGAELPSATNVEIPKDPLPEDVASVELSPIEPETMDRPATMDRQARMDTETRSDPIESAATEPSSGPDVADPFLPDPFSESMSPEADPAVVEPMVETEPVGKEPSLELSEAGSSDEAMTKEFKSTVPTKEAVQGLRERFAKLVPGFRSFSNRENAVETIQELAGIENNLELGSADFWVCRMMAAEVAWFSEGVDQVADRLRVLVENYDTSINDLLAESFVSAAGRADSQSVHQHRVVSGLRLCDRLLVDEMFAAATSVLDALEESVEFLGDTQFRSLIKQFKDAASQMQRQSDSTTDLLGASAKAELSKATEVEKGIAGRYLCLMRRQWEQGLPWLANGTDARMASLAKRELALVDDDATNMIDVAERWIAMASRSEGRAANSMRLHAVELLTTAYESATGLQKLELQRAIESHEAELPEYLAQQQPSPISDPLAKSEQAFVGLTGRIRVDGSDMGVQLRYQQPTMISDSILDKVGEKLERKFGTVTIELSGKLLLSKPAMIRVATSQHAAGAVNQVAIDGKAVSFSGDVNSSTDVFDAGEHTIRWQVKSSDLSGVFLDVRDVVSKEPIQIIGDYQRQADDVQTVLTVDIVSKTP